MYLAESLIEKKKELMDLNKGVEIHQVKQFKEDEEKAMLEDVKIEIEEREGAIKEAINQEWGKCEICIKLNVKNPQLASFKCNFEDTWCFQKERIEGCNKKCCLDHMFEND